MQSIEEIQSLCDKLYMPPSSVEEKLEVEKQFSLFKQSPEFLSQCVLVLQNSNSPQTQHTIAFAMHSTITERWNQFKDGPKSVELRNWLIQFLGHRGETLEDFVLTTVVKVTLKCSGPLAIITFY